MVSEAGIAAFLSVRWHRRSPGKPRLVVSMRSSGFSSAGRASRQSGGPHPTSNVHPCPFPLCDGAVPTATLAVGVPAALLVPLAAPAAAADYDTAWALNGAAVHRSSPTIGDLSVGWSPPANDERHTCLTVQMSLLNCLTAAIPGRERVIKVFELTNVRS